MILQLTKAYKSIHGLPVVSYVDTDIFTQNYPETGCLEMGCQDICCSGGAIMDSVTFKKLREVDEEDLGVHIDWETYEFDDDPCYPGGKGCYTTFTNNRCMFQNKNGFGCIIHSYCLKKGIDFRELKFFACCIFPCEVNNIGEYKNVLTPGYELRHDEYNFPCNKTGNTTIYENAKNDILYYFGSSLIEELETIKNNILIQVKG
ncbi:MAG: hypothetical protein JXJ04_11085 [Spirochaetales bacterium]|nr:hypothetical protein [Spirochaetales bacterium]